MPVENQINYIEIPVKHVNNSKQFFTEVFGWQYIDYGDEYSSISNAGIDAGIYKSDKDFTVAKGTALVVMYSENLELKIEGIKKAGGAITQEIFDFPGGRRFHFSDPNGNEFAVWSDKK